MYSVTSVSGKTLSFSGDLVDKINHCPISGNKGLRLQQKTMANHVYPKYWPLISKGQFYYCSDEECPVYYFNNDNKIYFGRDDIHSVVMHKMPINTENRPLCYCKNVLEKQVLDELLVKQCCDTLEDIKEYTGANSGKNCVITNPTGRCCGGKIKEVIDWAKEYRKEIKETTYQQAESCCVEIDKNVKSIELKL